LNILHRFKNSFIFHILSDIIVGMAMMREISSSEVMTKMLFLVKVDVHQRQHRAINVAASKYSSRLAKSAKGQLVGKLCR
jgi:hypothetical protein